ncbi:hypothetical protein SteCoe_17717 [Stentor coeruleus]|uniref:Uncharacterized protein n=1 Tax=Stentor coeruleus TaxID=5963 RepID=A0A1R2BY79_9CILI|nr:hypothetical protein SteCoe_17717 [Stentor coeruleus]
MEDEITVYQKTIENLEKIIEDDLLNDFTEDTNHELNNINILSSNIVKEIEFRGKNIQYLQELLNFKNQVPEISMPKILALNNEVSKLQKEIVELRSQVVPMQFGDDLNSTGQVEEQLVEQEMIFNRVTQCLKFPLCRECIDKK